MVVGARGAPRSSLSASASRRSVRLSALAAAFLFLGLTLSGCTRPEPGPDDDPEPKGPAAQADEEGTVVLGLGGWDQPLQLRDAFTDAPLPGLVAAAAPIAGADGRGILLVWDPAGQYPTQLIELVAQSAEDASPESLSLKAVAKAATAAVAVAPAGAHAIESVAVQALGTAENIGRLDDFDSTLDTVQLLFKELHSLGYGPAEWGVPATTTHETPDAVLQRVQKDALDGVAEEMVFLGVGLAVGGASGALVIGALLGVAVAATQAALDAATIETCRAQGANIAVTRIGPLTFLECEGPRPELWQWSTVRPEGIDRPSGLDFIQADNLTGWIRCDYDPQAQPTCPVPRGSYEVLAVSPGDTYAYGQVAVGDDEAVVQLDPQEFPDVEILLTSDPDLTGFLEPGAMVEFDAIAFYPNATYYPCDLNYVVINPPGTTVGSIDSTSGSFTAVEGPGAARVLARCDGFVSNAILVSTSAGSSSPTEPTNDWTSTTSSPPPPPPVTASVDAGQCVYIGEESTGPNSWDWITWSFSLTTSGTASGEPGTRLSIRLQSPGTAVFEEEPLQFGTLWTPSEYNREYYGSEVSLDREAERAEGDPEADAWTITAQVSKSAQRSYIPDFAGPHDYIVRIDVYGESYSDQASAELAVTCTIPG